MLNLLVTAIDIFTELMVIFIFVRVILSWFTVKNRFAELIFELTDPILSPIRKILPKASFLDFSPLVAILLLQGFQYLIHVLTKIPY